MNISIAADARFVTWYFYLFFAKGGSIDDVLFGLFSKQRDEGKASGDFLVRQPASVWGAGFFMAFDYTAGVWYSKNMKVYLDNCAYNRPFDDKEQLTIEMEAAAKLRIQDEIINSIKADHFDYTKWQENLWKNESIEEIHQKASASYKAAHGE